MIYDELYASVWSSMLFARSVLCSYVCLSVLPIRRLSVLSTCKLYDNVLEWAQNIKWKQKVRRLSMFIVWQWFFFRLIVFSDVDEIVYDNDNYNSCIDLRPSTHYKYKQYMIYYINVLDIYRYKEAFEQPFCRIKQIDHLNVNDNNDV